MQQLRSLALTLLALAVMVSSVTMAQARHQPRALGEVELCTSTGMITVQIDADGNPTGPMLPCPDCTVGVSGGEPSPAAATVLPLRLMALAPLLRDRPILVARTVQRRHARAPPAVI